MNNRAIRAALWTIIALPAVFLFVMMQYSAIVFPFWDHCELVKFFVKYHDGALTLSDLWAPHNHTRPLTYRTVMILNGALTDWDLRSEYFYLLGSLYGAFLILAATMWKTMGKRATTPALLCLAVISILSFSPAGHNNHWWSMMCQLTFTHFFCVAGLCVLAQAPLRWKNTLGAAVAFWLASYTLTNGIFGFLVAMIIAQIASERPLRPNRFTLFWVLNLLVLLPMYLPGLPENPSNIKAPDPLTLLYFALVYLGAPLLNLLHYSFQSIFFIPKPEWTAVVGFLQLAATGTLAWRRRDWLAKKSPEAILFLSFVAFAIISALATARGRAAFEGGTAAAGGSSRYTIFGSYAAYGLIFFLAGLARDGRLPRPRWGKVAFPVAYATLIILSTISYAFSIQVYRDAHGINERLNGAFHSPTPRPDLDANVYPSPAFVAGIKRDLKRLRIGPYRSYFNVAE